MIWSKYYSLILVALMVLVLVGCGESYTSRNTVATRSTEKSPFGFSPPTPEPTPTPNPLVPVIEKYISDVEQFQEIQTRLLAEHETLTLPHRVIFPSIFKTQLSELLVTESKHLDEWEMIEPPEVFIGFHETYQRGLNLSIERHDLLTRWMETIDGSTATQSFPRGQDSAIASDQQRVFLLASEAWFYGTNAYSILAGNQEVRSISTVVRPTRTSQFSTQIAAISSMTNCLVLNTHYEYALDSRWSAETEFAKRDADAYMAAVSQRLRAVCD